MVQADLFDSAPAESPASELARLRKENAKLRDGLVLTREHAQSIAAASGAAIGRAALASALRKGARLSVITDGQMSALDVVRIAAAACGEPVRLVMSTWTVGVKDEENVAVLAERGVVRELRFIVDRSFANLRSEQVASMQRSFGVDAVRVTSTHAKVYVVEGGGLCFAIRGSLNLNRNSRLENLDITEGAEALFWRDALLAMSEALPPVSEASEREPTVALAQVPPMHEAPPAEGFKARVLARMAQLREEARAAGQPVPKEALIPGLARLCRLSIADFRRVLAQGPDAATRTKIANAISLRI
jgi:hypothetical protein